MSREIKFRVWDKNDNVMRYDAQDTYDYIVNNIMEDCFGDVLKSERYEVMQYTECKDDNDTEIYEGDILKFNQYGDDRDYIARVEFGNPNGEYNWGWQLVFKEPFHLNNSILLWVEMAGVGCEVIGNIYENPELIKGKK